MNDMYILLTIITILLVTGITLPYIQEEFGVTAVENTYENIGGNVTVSNVAEFTVSSWDVIASLGKSFFWSFGTFPIWLEAIFLLFRITGLVIFIRIIRGVG